MSSRSIFTARFMTRITRWRRTNPRGSGSSMAGWTWTHWPAKSGRWSSPMFERFWGNAHVAQALEQMIERDRLAQTLLFAWPEGVGKATLARRLAARLL